jgi:hypothetical protein
MREAIEYPGIKVSRSAVSDGLRRVCMGVVLTVVVLAMVGAEAMVTCSNLTGIRVTSGLYYCSETRKGIRGEERGRRECPILLKIGCGVKPEV